MGSPGALHPLLKVAQRGRNCPQCPRANPAALYPQVLLPFSPGHPSTVTLPVSPLPPSERPPSYPPSWEKASLAVLTWGTSAARLPHHWAFSVELIAADTA